MIENRALLTRCARQKQQLDLRRRVNVFDVLQAGHEAVERGLIQSAKWKIRRRVSAGIARYAMLDQLTQRCQKTLCDRVNRGPAMER